MNRAEVLAIYDQDYAARYDERFLLAPWPQHGAAFELDLLRGLVRDGGRWLDACCGTGWFLAQMPEVDRTGLDLSPAMLARAREANPDPAVELREGDVCIDIPEWHGRFELVTCMWMAYCYLGSMAEVERMVANLAGYVEPGGALAITSVIDLEDLRFPLEVDGVRCPLRIPYWEDIEVFGGRVAITGHTWTWEEADGTVRENIIAVHPEHFIALLAPHFAEVELVRYPPPAPGGASRKAVVATGRRPHGETGEATITRRPIPLHPEDEARLAREQAGVEVEERARQEAVAANEKAWQDNDRAWRENERAWQENEVYLRSETERANAAEAEVDRLWGEVNRLSEACTALESLRAGGGGRPLASTPTRALARELARRVDPLRRMGRRPS